MLLKSILFMFVLVWGNSIAKNDTIDYGLYVKVNNTYQLVMEAVSSTIKAIPFYKLASQMSYDLNDREKYEKNKLLTIASIKQYRQRKNATRTFDSDRPKHFVQIEPAK